MWPLLIVLYTFEFNITDYICTQHTNLLNSMNYSFTVITLGLLSSSLLLSVVLYLRNVKYKKELKVQSEEILRLDMEYRKLYSNLFLQSCSSQNKKNEMEIKELLRRKPFVENDWIKIEEFINVYSRKHIKETGNIKGAYMLNKSIRPSTCIQFSKTDARRYPRNLTHAPKSHK